MCRPGACANLSCAARKRRAMAYARIRRVEFFSCAGRPPFKAHRNEQNRSWARSWLAAPCLALPIAATSTSQRGRSCRRCVTTVLYPHSWLLETRLVACSCRKRRLCLCSDVRVKNFLLLLLCALFWFRRRWCWQALIAASKGVPNF